MKELMQSVGHRSFIAYMELCLYKNGNTYKKKKDSEKRRGLFRASMCGCVSSAV